MSSTTIGIPGAVYEANRRFLWGLCYRMVGNAADADDLVQETFVRALSAPPPDRNRPWRPWLVKVAINLCRDQLRRSRRGYIGPWLPSPIPTDDDENPPSYEPTAGTEFSPAARYDLLESVTFAFLLALEALTPSQRAVLLLRDVFDYSTEETAEALTLTETNVKVILHRARQTMRDYDKNRIKPTAAVREQTKQALEQFLLYLQTRNVEALAQLLSDDVTSLSDGGGEFRAALRTVHGRDNVARLYTKLTEKYRAVPRLSFHNLNGLPALLAESDDPLPGTAPRFTLHCEIDKQGRIRRISSVLVPAKLSALEGR